MSTKHGLSKVMSSSTTQAGINDAHTTSGTIFLFWPGNASSFKMYIYIYILNVASNVCIYDQQLDRHIKGYIYKSNKSWLITTVWLCEANIAVCMLDRTKIMLSESAHWHIRKQKRITVLIQRKMSNCSTSGVVWKMSAEQTNKRRTQLGLLFKDCVEFWSKKKSKWRCLRGLILVQKKTNPPSSDSISGKQLQ